MKTHCSLVGLTVSTAFLLFGVSIVRADKPSASTPPPPAPPGPPAFAAPIWEGYSVEVAPKAKRANKLRLCIPYTPTNEDGSPGKRVLVTIHVDAQDREHALEAADQIIDQLLVEPRLEELRDEIDERIEEMLQSAPALTSPPPAPLPPPEPAQRDVRADDDTALPPPAEGPGTADETEPLDLTGHVTGALMVLDWMSPLLGLHVSLRPLALPLEIATCDPENAPQQMKVESGEVKKLRFHVGHLCVDYSGEAGQGAEESGEDAPKDKPPADESSEDTRPNGTLRLGWYFDSLPISQEWLKSLLNEQPAPMTYERVHGGIGP
jgi:hypothetical protein